MEELLNKVYTREKHLSYLITEALDKKHLSVQFSPALEVWSTIEGEIVKWMQKYNIKTGEKV